MWRWRVVPRARLCLSPQMVKFRPVDCGTKRPIRFDPGYISDVIYDVSDAAGSLHAYAGQAQLAA